MKYQQRIKDLREDKDLSQQQVAEILQIGTPDEGNTFTIRSKES